MLATDDEHARAIVEACAHGPGVVVEHVSDRTFLLHLGGKIEMSSKTPGEDARRPVDGLHPGRRARLRGHRRGPESAWNLTIKRNTVAIVTDGSAVLGLGDIGPAAAMPVMEGKALLFKEFGDVDAWPLCLATKDTDEIVATVQAIAPAFGGINLEDIAAPRCFEIEERLRASLDIPVFHDDQHGTAIVVLAAFLNALSVVGKRIEDVKVVVTGRRRRGHRRDEDAPRGGRAQRDRLRQPRGRLPRARRADRRQGALCRATNPGELPRHASEALAGADVFIGVSKPGAVSVEGVKRDGARRDRLRDGEPDPGDVAGGDRGASWR